MFAFPTQSYMTYKMLIVKRRAQSAFCVGFKNHVSTFRSPNRAHVDFHIEGLGKSTTAVTSLPICSQILACIYLTLSPILPNHSFHLHVHHLHVHAHSHIYTSHRHTCTHTQTHANTHTHTHTTHTHTHTHTHTRTHTLHIFL